MRTKTPRRAAAAFFLLAAGLTASHAQPAWKPEGNVEFVVGAGAGGENDRIARAIQHVLLKEHMVDSMTVLNRPGAAQTIAINYLAQQEGRRQRDRACVRQLHQRHRPQRLAVAQAVHAVDQAVRRLSGVFHRGRLADQEHGRGARPAQSRSERHHLRVPGRAWQSAARIRRQRRQGRGRAGEQAHHGGVQLGLRRRRAGRRPSRRRRPHQHRQSLSADPGRQASHARHRRAGASRRRTRAISDRAGAGRRRGHRQFLHRAACPTV